MAFDKYDYYTRSVQSPKTDVEFFTDTYKELRKKKGYVLTEDFCGTFRICCEWVKQGDKHRAIGVDLDSEPIKYGLEHYFVQLKASQAKRIDIKEANVMDEKLPSSDLIVAVNFSYYIFKQRRELLKYFKNAHRRLEDDGLFFIDCFGGSETMEPNEEETVHKGFSYYWDQDSFDPISNFAQFYIHFKIKGKKKKEKVFSYDWRMWTIPELRDLLEEAGFSKTHVYWEGTTKDGEGDGEFKRTEKGEDCEAWVAYIVGEK